jgi:glyoxalase family protein
MSGPIAGLHHVTATVGEAQADLDFFAGVLGLRLVKRTVNFDNTGVYHFYYGNARGQPSTIMTTFPYAGQGVRTGRTGAGQITATAFSVPAGALETWRRRLGERGLAARDAIGPFGEPALQFTDPSGLALRLVEDGSDPREPWIAPGVTAASAIRGVHSVTLHVRDPRKSLEFLTGVLGFAVVGEAERRTRVAVGGEVAGRSLEIVAAPDEPAAVNGLGTVHHVAFAVPDPDEQVRMRAELVRLGYAVTEVLDRQYFRSIYFHEPGGVLYEMATVPPGFTVDEDVAELGCGLKLPPWEEARRRAIEAALPAVVPP